MVYQAGEMSRGDYAILLSLLGLEILIWLLAMVVTT
jgi:hypothetical protein